ncbi:hypothetical protein EV146_108254 [Mesobacillus foraminis]|uniref:Uncharacterized protein n=1 Tax=Mesobacillus foraminis TaxID=279826 RepID=A0A4V2RDD5_9BACI|nr:hypothetical protein EV146_108254 [Mesobacillus foraminis]
MLGSSRLYIDYFHLCIVPGRLCIDYLNLCIDPRLLLKNRLQPCDRAPNSSGLALIKKRYHPDTDPGAERHFLFECGKPFGICPLLFGVKLPSLSTTPHLCIDYFHLCTVPGRLCIDFLNLCINSRFLLKNRLQPCDGVPLFQQYPTKKRRPAKGRLSHVYRFKNPTPMALNRSILRSSLKDDLLKSFIRSGVMKSSF